MFSERHPLSQSHICHLVAPNDNDIVHTYSIYLIMVMVKAESLKYANYPLFLSASTRFLLHQFMCVCEKDSDSSPQDIVILIGVSLSYVMK